MNLIDIFLKRAANRLEQRFWIGRTYNYIQQYSDSETVRLWGDLTSYRLPRRIREVPHLETVAKVWKFETENNKAPSCEEMIKIMEEAKL